MLVRLAIVLLGLVVGVHGAVVHRLTAGTGDLGVPWGLALALAATGLVAWVAAVATPVGAAWFGLGWTAAVLAQQSVAPGSYLIAADALGWTYMAGGLVVLVVIGVVHARGPRPASD